MRQIKLETALTPKKTPQAMLDSQSRYYHEGAGKAKWRARYAKFTPEIRAARRATSLAWKARNAVRVTCLRIASSALHRVSKHCHEARGMNAWELMGCHVGELQQYLEAQFRDGIDWSTRKTWHVDHIRPLCEFDLSNLAQVREAFRFSNLQILPIRDHEDKARGESRVIMEKTARLWWSRNRASKYPCFRAAWAALSAPKAR